MTNEEIIAKIGNVGPYSIAMTVEFPAEGTFVAIGKAEKHLADIGYSVGSMCSDAPIGFAEGKDRYVSKWYNLGEDKKRLDGVILPNPEFREGGAIVVIFRR